VVSKKKIYFPEQPGNERRQTERYQYLVQLSNINGSCENIPKIIDISTLGAQIESSFPMTINQKIEFSFSLPDQEVLFSFSGNVKWVKEISRSPGLYYIGIQFINPYRGLSRIFFKSPPTIDSPVEQTGLSCWKKFWKFLSD
jgi:hypothetical protein